MKWGLGVQVQAFSDEALAKLDQFLPQNLSNLVWAYATLAQQPGNALLDAVSRIAVGNMSNFTTQVGPVIPVFTFVAL